MTQHMLVGKAPILVLISAPVSNYNLYVAAGSPTGVPVEVIVTNNSIVNSTVPGGAAFTVDSRWPAGSKITIVNNGQILGTGGTGGYGGDASSSGNAGRGANGQLALNANQGAANTLNIDNTNGLIFGGGGGGGGGPSDGFATYVPGGGGGGGRGGSPSPGGTGGHGSAANGADGSPGGPAGGGNGGAGNHPGGLYSGGDGGYGADYGQTGQSGTGGGGGSVGQVGGGPGQAVKTNGFTINWLGGYNSGQVKGPVSA